MVANGQLNMFESDTPVPVLPLPEHLNYGLQEDSVTPGNAGRKAVMKTTRSIYRGFCFPPEVIAHAVFLYHRFPLSLRDVEDRLAQRGIAVSSETIRRGCRRFGPHYARNVRRPLTAGRGLLADPGATSVAVARHRPRRRPSRYLDATTAQRSSRHTVCPEAAQTATTVAESVCHGHAGPRSRRASGGDSKCPSR